MLRVGRVVIPGCGHHVTQRGNNRQDIFFVATTAGRIWTSCASRRASTACGSRIEGYCLMTNHVHLLARPERPQSLAKAVGRTHWLYSQQINRLHGRSGHLWQNRFYSCALDEGHYWQALAYVERNPVRAGLVGAAWQWPWSSAGAHVGQDERRGLLDLSAWWSQQSPAGWRETLGAGMDQAHLSAMRLATARGRPPGSDTWLSRLETSLNRRLRPRPVGRPTKRREEGGNNR